MKKVLARFLCFFIVTNIYAQKEDYQWVGGYQTNTGGMGANGFLFDFNTSPTKPKYKNIRLGFDSSQACISDSMGQLLFYCNGRGVTDRLDRALPNGDGINAGEWADRYWPEPFRGYPGFQDIIILDDPGRYGGYYLLHKTPVYDPSKTIDQKEIRMSYVDMNLNDGFGEVTFKNQYFYTPTNLLTSYLTAIKHQNKKDWWIIQPIREDSIFLTFLLSSSGITRMPDQNTHQFFDNWRSSASGTAQFSPDGSKYAIYNYFDQLHIYDFDRLTGIFSNHKKINIYPPESIDRNAYNFGSVEWSPNGRFIYTASDINLHQIDTYETDIKSSVALIDSFNGTKDPFDTDFFLLAQAPDCRILLTPKNGSYSLHVINSPDEKGKDCNFVQNGIKLPNSNGGSFPNFPKYRVDEEKKCNPEISSVFGEHVYTVKQMEVCPNPSADMITLGFTARQMNGDIYITDMVGKILIYQHFEPNNEKLTIDISVLPEGIYLVEIISNIDKEIYQGKFIKK